MIWKWSIFMFAISSKYSFNNLYFEILYSYKKYKLLVQLYIALILLICQFDVWTQSLNAGFYKIMFVAKAAITDLACITELEKHSSASQTRTCSGWLFEVVWGDCLEWLGIVRDCSPRTHPNIYSGFWNNCFHVQVCLVYAEGLP